jgi:hypothetical protein
MCQLLRRAHPWPHQDGAGTGIVDGGPRWGVAGLLLLPEPPKPFFLPFPFHLPLALPPLLGVGQEGEGLPEDMMVPAVVGVGAAAATEGALLLKAPSRMRRPVPGPPSCPS